MNKTLIQIFKNTASSWGAIAIQAVIGVVMVPFLLGRMGTEGYGVIGIIGAIVAFSSIADMGLRAALERELTEKVALKDEEGFRRLSSTALFIYLIIAILIGSVGYVMAPWLCSLFNVSEQYHDLVIILLRTYALFTLLLSFITPVYAAGICSFMRYDVQNHITSASQFVVSLLLFICLSVFDYNPLVIWCMVMALGAVLRLGLMFIFYRRHCYGGKIGPRWIELKSLKPLFKLGGSMYILQLTQMMAVQMDPLIISKFIGPSGVALYQAGSRLPQMINPLVTSLTSQLTPLTTKYHIASNNDREQQVLVFGTKYTLYLGALFSAMMLVFADAFCHLWLFNQIGNDVASVALILKLWAVANLLRYAGTAGYPILLARKKMSYLLWLNVPTAIFNLILSIYLVAYANIGVAGVMMGTLVTDIVRRLVGTWYLPRVLNLSIISFVKTSYLTPILLFAVLLATGSSLGKWVGTESWHKMAFSSMATGIVGACLITVFEWPLVKKYLGDKFKLFQTA
jgi:O-antigen/teichoic acid export membrane protein